MKKSLIAYLFFLPLSVFIVSVLFLLGGSWDLNSIVEEAKLCCFIMGVFCSLTTLMIFNLDDHIHNGFLKLKSLIVFFGLVYGFLPQTVIPKILIIAIFMLLYVINDIFLITVTLKNGRGVK